MCHVYLHVCACLYAYACMCRMYMWKPTISLGILSIFVEMGSLVGLGFPN